MPTLSRQQRAKWAPLVRLGRGDRPPLLVSHKHKFVYIPIPRVASTSTKRWLCELENVVWRGKRLHGLVNRRFGLTMRNTPAVGGPADFFIFMFVRNPLSRLVSAFTSQFQTELRYPNERALALASRIGGGGGQITFRMFVQFLACQNDLRKENRHWRPQYLFVDNALIDYVGKLEAIGEAWQVICRALRLQQALPYMSVSRLSGSWVKDDCLADIPMCQLVRREPFHWFNFYDEMLYLAVQELFAEDFSRFDYPRVAWHEAGDALATR